MRFIAIPDHVLNDPSLTDAEVRLLCVLLAYSGPGGSELGVRDLAAKSKQKLGVAKKLLKELVEKGRLEVTEGGYRVTECFQIAEQAEPLPKIFTKKQDLFDDGDVDVSDKAVSSLISTFIESGLNPAIKGDQAKARFYGSPHNRKGAKVLIQRHGPLVVADLIQKLARKRSDAYFPTSIKSLWSLAEGWDKARAFLDRGDEFKKKAEI
jgi:hypothetical protein